MFRMKFFGFIFVFLSFVFVISWAGRGFALTLDFEEQSFVNEQFLQGTGYGGFTWDANIVAMENSFYRSNYGNTIDFPSNDIAVVNGYGTFAVSISRNEPFDFIGAYFSAFATDDQMASYSSTSVTLKGYNGATLVGASTFTLSPTFSFFSANFSSINRLELQSSGNDQWWIMDNFEYKLPNTVVPEPQTLGMFLLFIGGLPFVHRRKK